MKKEWDDFKKTLKADLIKEGKSELSEKDFKKITPFFNKKCSNINLPYDKYYDNKDNIYFYFNKHEMYCMIYDDFIRIKWNEEKKEKRENNEPETEHVDEPEAVAEHVDEPEAVAEHEPEAETEHVDVAEPEPETDF